MGSRIVFAAMTGHLGGTGVMLNEGEPWDADDPVVRDNLRLFTDRPPHVRTSRPAEAGSAEPWGPPLDDAPGVEQATAAPGERRTLTAPAATRRGA